MEKDIGKISKGEYQGTVTDIVVGIKEYNGRVGIDIREFTQSESYTGPTKKGLRIPADKFDEFKTIINSINPEDLKVESAQKDLSESPDEDSGIDESGLM
ncbi:transcriptional coactivator p15/PC4 family protein [Candidatus Pacearchaeota archaeon]|nr:transcriptional coactivator p15/PC4 family protein [Candidatus Pacearchaeota archaeon]